MLHFERLDNRRLLIVTTDGPLEEEDFTRFAAQIDTGGASGEKPNRLMIVAASFPGWESFEAFLVHLKFVIEHHKQIEKIAVVSDSDFLKVMPRIGSLFVHPKIRQFEIARKDEASAWLDTTQ